MKTTNIGICAALLAAALFGAGTPFAKALLEHTSPWLLAALLYLGSGLGLGLVRMVQGAPRVALSGREWKWMSGAVICGGVIGPVLLMSGLDAMPASGASLLLNAESVFTALLAWFVFRENFDHRIALGMIAIVAGAIVLAWPVDGTVAIASFWPALAVLGACLAWAMDNNLTRKVSLSDASWIAMVKGLVAGLTNLVLAASMGAVWPATATLVGAAILGFFSYGASLVLFVIALRHLGSGRTGAYFSVAPFFGAAIAVLFFGESFTLPLFAGGVLMAVGVALHLSESHAHAHSHMPLEHTHEHEHGPGDSHHEHSHDELVAPGTRHSHRHSHQPLSHSHPHFPDMHHRHEH